MWVRWQHGRLVLPRVLNGRKQGVRAMRIKGICRKCKKVCCNCRYCLKRRSGKRGICVRCFVASLIPSAKKVA